MQNMKVRNMKMLKSDRLRSAGTSVAARLVALLWALLALPVAAWADDDDKPIPIDPKVAAAQNWTIGIIFGLVCLAIVWYYLRRWQIMRSGNQVHGDSRTQD
jgi:membrane protease YdiL (CAAX protease family)